MNEAIIIVSTLAIIFSGIALIVSCVGIAMVCGFLRSTHTVQWKTLDNPFQQEAEELLEETEEIVEPKKNKRPKDFAFMDEVADMNNF